jgi:spoIIIJ-associated protein
MKKEVFVGKTKEEAITKAMEGLNAKEEELVIVEKEIKKSLFNKKAEIEAITKDELNKEIRDYILKTVKDMGINAKIETKTREETIVFNLIAPETPILIGKNGRTIEAIQNVTNQMINTNLGTYYRFIIDVNDYKSKRKARLEKNAKYTAKEVAKTKVEAHLEPMNSYERRIIHNILTNSKDVMTESEGEEPNRHVVIKPKEVKKDNKKEEKEDK